MSNDPNATYLVNTFNSLKFHIFYGYLNLSIFMMLESNCQWAIAHPVHKPILLSQPKNSGIPSSAVKISNSISHCPWNRFCSSVLIHQPDLPVVKITPELLLISGNGSYHRYVSKPLRLWYDSSQPAWSNSLWRTTAYRVCLILFGWILRIE